MQRAVHMGCLGLTCRTMLIMRIALGLSIYGMEFKAGAVTGYSMARARYITNYNRTLVDHYRMIIRFINTRSGRHLQAN